MKSSTEESTQLDLLSDTLSDDHLSAPAASEGVSFPKSFDEWLSRWCELGWLRSLDRHFAHFMESDDHAVQLAAALVSHQLGRGHICLDLSRVIKDSSAVLSLPPQDGRSLEEAPTVHELLQRLNIQSAEEWCERLKASSLVSIVDPENESLLNAAPMVLDGSRLYLYRLWRAEGNVAAIIRNRVRDSAEITPSLKQGLGMLFEDSTKQQPDWQKVACAVAALKQLAIISGGPGTGKTTTVVKLLALLQQQALQQTGNALTIRLTAPTGKAAARLSESISGAIDRVIKEEQLKPLITREATTLHRLLGTRPDSCHFIHDASNPLPLDVLVIDEASMIDLEMMHATLTAIPSSARIILLGDKDQLASVEAGAVLGELCSDSDGFSLGMQNQLEVVSEQTIPDHQPSSPLSDNVVTLKHSYRFDSQSGIGALARAVNQGDIPALKHCWGQGFEDIHLIELKDEHDQKLLKSIREGYRGYLRGIKELAPSQALEKLGEFQILCGLRRGPWGVEGLNVLIERELSRHKLIQPDSEWYVGRPVMVTRNDNQLGLFNGDVGLTLADPQDPHRLRVYFALQNGIRAVSPSRLDAVETAYAMTVHKSQGSEFSNVLLVLPDSPNPIMTRELVYTGITRAKKTCSIATAAPWLIEYAAQQSIWRDANLRERLQRQV